MAYEHDLLKELMEIPSITGTEGKICQHVFDLLNEKGFNPKKYGVSKDRFNMVASLSDQPKVYLQAHLDTVPPFIPFSEDQENIYGRGACDTKCSASAMITASLICKEKGLKNFGLIFTVGEETLLDGAESLIKTGFQVPFVIVGEPSSLEIVNEHFGLLIIKIRSDGKAAHSSRPEEGINALDKLLSYIQKIKSLEIYPTTLMSLVKVNGGEADNIIPPSAEATFSFRIAPGDTKDYFKEFSDLTSERITLEKIIDVDSVHTNVSKELDFIKTRRTVKYFTELSFFQNGVIIGPGDIKYAHGEDERVSKEELTKAVEVYSQIIKNFS